jgi:hypothetical protein
MQQLAKALEQHVSDSRSDEMMPENSMPQWHLDLQVASEKWAVAALRTYRGAQLNKALAVSAAVNEFLAELEASVHA